METSHINSKIILILAAVTGRLWFFWYREVYLDIDTII